MTKIISGITVCDNSDCVVCLESKWQRLIRLFEKADARAKRIASRPHRANEWLDAIGLRTRIGTAKIDAWFDYESALYTYQTR